MEDFLLWKIRLKHLKPVFFVLASRGRLLRQQTGLSSDLREGLKMVDGDHVQLETSETVTVYFIQLSVLLLVMEYFYCEVFALLTEVKQPSSKWNLMNLRDENVSSVCKYSLQCPAHVLLAVIRPLPLWGYKAWIMSPNLLPLDSKPRRSVRTMSADRSRFTAHSVVPRAVGL